MNGVSQAVSGVQASASAGVLSGGYPVLWAVLGVVLALAAIAGAVVFLFHWLRSVSGVL